MVTIIGSEMNTRILQLALHSRRSEKKVRYHVIYKPCDIHVSQRL